MVKFHSVQDMKEIFYAGPYTINNVKFPKLPMRCWSSDSLSRIASLIGTPIYADECTSKQTRISFARMLIEVNATKALPEEVAVMEPNREVIQQRVTYD